MICVSREEVGMREDGFYWVKLLDRCGLSLARWCGVNGKWYCGGATIMDGLVIAVTKNASMKSTSAA